jgi:hypothetical protein
MRFAAERGSNNSREARRVDFVGLLTNNARTDCFHTFIAHTRSATSLAIMDARKRPCQSLIA